MTTDVGSVHGAKLHFQFSNPCLQYCKWPTNIGMIKQKEEAQFLSFNAIFHFLTLL